MVDWGSDHESKSVTTEESNEQEARGTSHWQVSATRWEGADLEVAVGSLG